MQDDGFRLRRNSLGSSSSSSGSSGAAAIGGSLVLGFTFVLGAVTFVLVLLLRTSIVTLESSIDSSGLQTQPGTPGPYGDATCYPRFDWPGTGLVIDPACLPFANVSIGGSGGDIGGTLGNLTLRPAGGAGAGAYCSAADEYARNIVLDAGSRVVGIDCDTLAVGLPGNTTYGGDDKLVTFVVDGRGRVVSAANGSIALTVNTAFTGGDLEGNGTVLNIVSRGLVPGTIGNATCTPIVSWDEKGLFTTEPVCFTTIFSGGDVEGNGTVLNLVSRGLVPGTTGNGTCIPVVSWDEKGLFTFAPTCVNLPLVLPGGGGIVGTANQIIVTPAGNLSVLSTPQDIAPSSNVQFNDILATGTIVANDVILGRTGISVGPELGTLRSTPLHLWAQSPTVAGIAFDLYYDLFNVARHSDNLVKPLQLYRSGDTLYIAHYLGGPADQPVTAGTNRIELNMGVPARTYWRFNEGLVGRTAIEQVAHFDHSAIAFGGTYLNDGLFPFFQLESVYTAQSNAPVTVLQNTPAGFEIRISGLSAYPTAVTPVRQLRIVSDAVIVSPILQALTGVSVGATLTTSRSTPLHLWAQTPAAAGMAFGLYFDTTNTPRFSDTGVTALQLYRAGETLYIAHYTGGAADQPVLAGTNRIEMLMGTAGRTYWRFNEGIGRTAIEQVAHADHAAIAFAGTYLGDNASPFEFTSEYSQSLPNTPVSVIQNTPFGFDFRVSSPVGVGNPTVPGREMRITPSGVSVVQPPTVESYTGGFVLVSDGSKRIVESAVTVASLVSLPSILDVQTNAFLFTNPCLASTSGGVRIRAVRIGTSHVTLSILGLQNINVGFTCSFFYAAGVVPGGFRPAPTRTGTIILEKTFGGIVDFNLVLIEVDTLGGVTLRMMTAPLILIPITQAAFTAGTWRVGQDATFSYLI